MRTSLMLIGMLIGCAAEEPAAPIEEPTFWLEQALDVRTSPLAADGSDVVWLQGGRSLLHIDGTVWLQDPRVAQAEPLLMRRSELRGGSWLGGDALLIATEQGLSFWDGEIRQSPLQARVSGPVQALLPAGESLWLLDDAGWHWTLDGVWSTPTVSGEAARQDLIPLGERAAWLRHENQLVQVRRRDGGWELVEHWEIPELRSVAVDGDRVVWASDGLDLHRRIDAQDWAVEMLPGAVAQVAASPDAPGVWVQTPEGAWHGDSTGVAPVEVPAGWWLGSDPHGGLIVRTEQGLSAARIRPALELLDLPRGGLEGIGTLTLTVAVQPSAGLSDLTLDLDGVPLLLTEQAPFQATIDAQALSRGSHTLSLEATWQDGTRHAIERSLESTSGAVTWRDHIQPIFQDQCQVCHGGSADTVLETSQDWSENIELILEQVENDRMPLGNDPLPPEDISLIQAWRDGGFE